MLFCQTLALPAFRARAESNNLKLPSRLLSSAFEAPRALETVLLTLVPHCPMASPFCFSDVFRLLRPSSKLPVSPCIDFCTLPKLEVPRPDHCERSALMPP